MRNKLMKLNLQLFAEGGATGEGAPSGQVQSGENTQVVYGKQPEESAPQSAAPAAGEQNAEGNAQSGASEETFEELIKGKYKKDFDKTVHNVVGRRLSAEKAKMSEERAKAQKANDTLLKVMAVHGVNSLEELNRILDSESILGEMSSRNGESNDTNRELLKLRVSQMKYEALERNLERTRREAERERQKEEMVNEQLEKWRQSAESVKEKYPDFDMNTELQNSEFVKMLERGVNVEHAYKVIHLEDFMKAAEAEAAAKFAKSVNARAMRPSENGLGNQSGITVKNDVSKLTKKDRAEIARRVARGEKIEF